MFDNRNDQPRRETISTDMNAKNESVQAKQPNMKDLVANNPVKYYENLLNLGFMSKVQKEIVEAINTSGIMQNYDSLAIAVGMVLLVEDTLTALISDAIHSQGTLEMPGATPEQLTAFVNNESKKATENIIEITTYLSECMNVRQQEQINKRKAGGNSEIDRPAHDVLAICAIFRQALSIMINTMKDYAVATQRRP
jgi:hypothetical protein